MQNPNTTTVNISLAQQFLLKILSEKLAADQFLWLESTVSELQNNWDKTSFHLAFGMVARKIPRDLITDSLSYKTEAEAILNGWAPYLWSADRIARVLLLTYAPLKQEVEAQAFIWDVFDTADMWEQVSIFSALPILTYPEAYVKIATEGLRTNMTPVFDSIALDNPYPALHFKEEAWNQMFLKAAFMERPLYRIQKIPERSNQSLSRIVLDYVHERWAAGREVSPEIWQACTKFLSPQHIEALLKLATHAAEMQRAAVALLQNRNSETALQDLDLQLTSEWTWEKLGREYNSIEH